MQQIIHFQSKIVRTIISVFVIGLIQVVAAPTAPAAVVLTINDSDPALKFDYSTADKNGTKGSIGTGALINDRIIYRNAGTYGGTSVDVVVTTVAIASGSISVYDNPGSATSATGSANYWMINTVGGDARFRFEFFKGGSYTGTGTGIPVILQNLKVTSIDIDTSGTGANQYSDFTGFQKYSMTSPTNLAVIAQPTVANEPNRIRFIANLAGSRSSVPEDQVMVKYDAVSLMEIAFGNIKAGSTNYFGLIFGGWPGSGNPVEYPNLFNTPPTSSNVTLGVSDSQSAPSTLALSAFGNYQDADFNPFTQVKIATVPASGKLQKLNGNSWVDVAAGDIISVADIESGKLRYYPASPAVDTSFTFYVHDGLDYSLATYTTSLVVKSGSNVITFNNPGTKAPSQTFASGASASSGLTVTLTSNTPGICTVDGSGNITTVTSGICSITATQGGDSTHPAAAPVTQEFPVTSKTPQVITFPNPGTKTETTVAFVSNATTNASGLYVTLTSADTTICTVNNSTGGVPTITPLKSGTCVITATQAGNSTYDPATPVTVSFPITAPGGGGTTTVSGPQVKTVGAESITVSSPYGATLFGLISPNGVSGMTYKFCWTASSNSSDIKSVTSGGVTTYQMQSTKNVMCSASSTNVVGAGPNISVSEAITQFKNDSTSPTNLYKKKTYYFQVIGTASGKSYYGEVMSFYIPDSGSTWVYGRTLNPSNVTETTATLNGSFNSNKTTVEQTYCLTTDPATVGINFRGTNFQNVALKNCQLYKFTGTKLATSLPSANTESATSAAITGLTGDTWYYFQVLAKETSKKYYGYGKIIAFKTAAKTPVATTLPVTVFGNGQATLPGSVLANGDTTTVDFCYGTSSVLASCTTVSANPASVLGSTAKSVSVLVTGLTQGTRYYYQVRATRTSDSASSNGSIKTFVLGAPSVSTLAATAVETDTSNSVWKAKLNGYLKPMGYLSTPLFCYGTSNSVDSDGKLLSCTTETATAVDSTTANMSISLNIAGLTGGVKYYFQAKAINREYVGPELWSYGEVMEFTTSFAPDAVTLDPTSVGATYATLNGTVTSLGDTATARFCLSTSNARTPDDNSILLNCDYSLSISENANSELIGTNQSGTQTASGLNKTTTYYYQISATNKMGSAVGEVKTFTTNAGGPLATTLPSEYVSNTSSTIYGDVNSNGSNTTAYFCLSIDSTTVTVDGGESMTACSKFIGSVGSLINSGTTTSVSESYTATGLTTSTKYFYQIFATNARGETTYGNVLSFALNTPIATTNSTVDSITASSATIRGSANKNSYGSAIHAGMCFAATEDLDPNGLLLDCNDALITMSSVSSTSNLSQGLTDLNPGTEYFYQAFITLSSDTATAISVGRVYSFKTVPMVTFDANGGVGGPDTQTASTATNLRTISSLNYTLTNASFLRWNTSADGSGTDYADGVSYNFTENLTLYAIWSDPSSTYSVTYDLNGGSGTTPTEGNKSSGQTFAAASGTGITKSGYTFGGWSCASTTYAAGATITVGSANMICTAIWNAVVTPAAPTVVKKKIKITWRDPATIKFGTPLSGTQLNASTDVPSTCVYTPAAGTILPVGKYTLKVVCTPVDGTNYEPLTAEVTIEVKGKNKPQLIWFNPQPIVNPTPLSGTQLNAIGSVPGKYIYNPPAGTILVPGKHPLKVTFTPDNQDDNESLEANVTIQVLEKKDDKPVVAPTAPVSLPDTKTITTPAPAVILQTAGKQETVTVRQNDEKTGIIVSSADWSLAIKSTTQFVQGNTQDTSARVVIEKGNTVTTSGTGFKPFSQVDVWVYSTPTWLGAVMTDEFGNFTTTLPMPATLPEGDHTFQAKGQTPESTERTAAVPITLVPATVINKPGSLRFEVYFGMNSPIVTNKEKARIAKLVAFAQSKIAQGSKITVEIDGWVQPNPNPGDIKYLSTHRANNVAVVLRALGLKGMYTLKYPGLAKDNIPTARHASVVIKWSKSK